MKTLIVEDYSTSRLLLRELLKSHGPCDIAANGQEAVEAVRMALATDAPYNLICLDMMMPQMDGQEALRQIRELEEARGIFFPDGASIVMTTALDDMANVGDAFYGLCDTYLTKPIQKVTLMTELRKLNLIL